jgi:hypothetical protein
MDLRGDDLDGMNSRQPHTRVRPFRVAACLACAFVVVLGLSSAPASATSQSRGTKLIVTDTQPSQPTAGQNYTMYFQLQKGGVPLTLVDGGCYALAGGRVAAIVDQKFSGSTGHCTWSIPAAAKGKTFDGFITVKADGVPQWFRGFDLAIG